MLNEEIRDFEQKPFHKDLEMYAETLRGLHFGECNLTRNNETI